MTLFEAARAPHLFPIYHLFQHLLVFLAEHHLWNLTQGSAQFFAQRVPLAICRRHLLPPPAPLGEKDVQSRGWLQGVLLSSTRALAGHLLPVVGDQ